MKLVVTPLQGLWVVESSLHEDNRGSFTRFFCNLALKKTSNELNISQINISKTHKVGAIRGMHFQYPPHSEVKMVRCLRGQVFDVAVDMRQHSDTFLHWHAEELSCENLRMMIIPKGFAHGFQVMEKDSELLYLHSAAYVPESEGAIRFDEPKVKIKWPLPVSDISERDKNIKYLDNDFQGIQI